MSKCKKYIYIFPIRLSSFQHVIHTKSIWQYLNNCPAQEQRVHVQRMLKHHGTSAHTYTKPNYSDRVQTKRIPVVCESVVQNTELWLPQCVSQVIMILVVYVFCLESITHLTTI